jgi:chemotaxis protein MotB
LVDAAPAEGDRTADGADARRTAVWRTSRITMRPDESAGPPWLVTYGDLLTNMLVVFMMIVGVMALPTTPLPTSPPTVGTLEADPTPLVLFPFPATTPDPPEESAAPQVPPVPPTLVPPAMAPLAAAPPATVPPATAPIAVPTPPDGVPVDAWATGVARWLWDAMASDAIAADAAVAVDDRTVTVRLGDRVLFDLASADLRPEAVGALQRVGVALARVGAEVRVEGHTDDLPIATARFPSNWELSTARAAAVVRVLAGAGMPSRRLAATGYADARPLMAGATAEARAANRRVELVVTPRP